ncbi:hypothetical protein GcM3_c11894o35 [Golovinomyces cichoracearum]|uniref:Secreted protein n=1 Tax=Golovinomyces cichoracearum TaxID=62708 RepID=A0A420J8W7_9PEZI|nr:hypothetical protein GcM3_c11894o35 [Golovinomyces cichoracearum]
MLANICNAILIVACWVHDSLSELYRKNGKSHPACIISRSQYFYFEYESFRLSFDPIVINPFTTPLGTYHLIFRSLTVWNKPCHHFESSAH